MSRMTTSSIDKIMLIVVRAAAPYDRFAPAMTFTSRLVGYRQCIYNIWDDSILHRRRYDNTLLCDRLTMLCDFSSYFC